MLISISEDVERNLNVERTETKNNFYYTEKQMVVYHYNDNFIEKFGEYNTCFYNEFKEIEGHVYALVIPKGKFVEEYQGGLEIRVNLQKDMDIYYLGQLEKDGYTIKSRYPCEVRSYNYNYKNINNELLNELKEV